MKEERTREASENRYKRSPPVLAFDYDRLNLSLVHIEHAGRPENGITLVM